jgi:adenosylmethionine-8-amino-7-oxononanoate aminotransferase
MRNRQLNTTNGQSPPPPRIDHASGAYLWDIDGGRWLDGCSCAVNVNIGHGVPEVVERMREQAERVCFVYRSQFASPALDQLRRRLADLAPPDLAHAEFANSGSEAVEAALRIAVAYHHRRGDTDRSVILGDRPSYHGITAGALGCSGHPRRRRAVDAMLSDDTVIVGVSSSDPDHIRPGLEDWRTQIRQIGSDRIAAIIVEPIGGAACGAVPLDQRTLTGLREECDRQGILLIADEVMTGLGRTGRWFGCQHAGVVPDLLTLGKGLSSGYTPMAATLVHRRLLPVFDGQPSVACFGHTTTANPLSAATTLAVLDYTQRHDLAARAARLGAPLSRSLRDLAAAHPIVTEVRGRGLLIGLGLGAMAGNGGPLATTDRLVDAARAERLLIYPSGVDAATQSVLVAPPLTITDAAINDLLHRLDRALSRLEAGGCIRPAGAADMPRSQARPAVEPLLRCAADRRQSPRHEERI